MEQQIFVEMIPKLMHESVLEGFILSYIKCSWMSKKKLMNYNEENCWLCFRHAAPALLP